MAPPRSDSPRKKPTQARAQATVEAILRATAHILRTAGWDACNTNAVAKRAGVSIGSLYQYFPSKEALVAALAEEHATLGLGVLMEAVTAAPRGTLTFEDTVRHYIRAMVALHAVDPKLHRVLVEQVPRLKGGLDVVRRVSTQSAALVRSWLETQRKHLRAVDLDVATFILVTAVESVAHLQVLDRPPQLDQEALVEELSELVLGYLGVTRRASR
ncbi:MAG: TetR/AcrR family transcriptional regulator [Archangium sp.]|nr:TetR/AcrR family transcriptional regulator [Archangium sp.]